jgi:FtsP/CotA-like multicopper oxidase with cupredoxin domain
LSEARIENGQTFAAMPMSGMEANYFTFNGKSSPDTETIQAKQGDTVRIRLYNIGQLSHPIHLHGMAFKIVAIDGFAVPATQQLLMDTVSIAPGQRYDIEFVASEVGKWMLHCHISHHLTNGDNHAEGEGGMMTIIEVSE